jgi:hypothetical protein
MVLALLALAAAHTECPSRDIHAAVQLVVQAIRQKEYSCIRRMIINPSFKFDGDTLNSDVVTSLAFHAPGNRSFYDIVSRNGIRVALQGSGIERRALLIDRRYYAAYLKNDYAFENRYLWKQYFYCDFKLVDGVWMLTQDFCNTEGEEND